MAELQTLGPDPDAALIPEHWAELLGWHRDHCPGSPHAPAREGWVAASSGGAGPGAATGGAKGLEPVPCRHDLYYAANHEPGAMRVWDPCPGPSWLIYPALPWIPALVAD